jgi:hypothetical protein
VSETEREKNEPPLPPALERLKAGDFFLDWSSYGTGLVKQGYLEEAELQRFRMTHSGYILAGR